MYLFIYKCRFLAKIQCIFYITNCGKKYLLMLFKQLIELMEIIRRDLTSVKCPIYQDNFRENFKINIDKNI